MRSVAILPITNLTGDASLDSDLDRLTEDLMQLTGRGGYILVAPRNATFAWKGRPTDERLLGRELHVRNVVIASLRKAAPGYRVSFQIVDTASGRIVASDEVGRAAPDGNLPTNRLATALFNAIAHILVRRWYEDELSRAVAAGDPENLMARIVKHIEDGKREEIAETTLLIETAVKTLPGDHGLRPWLMELSCWYYNGLVRGGFYASRAQRTEWAEAALDFARQGGELRPVATGPHACGAEALTKLERWEEGMAEAEYAVEAAPLVDSGYRARAHLEVARGAFGDALRDYAELEAREEGEDADEAYHVELAFLHLLAGNYDSAIRELRPWLVVEPRNPSAPFFLAAAQELSGHHDEAVAASRLYGRLKSDDGIWEMLAQSHEPAFLDAARTVRNALHDAGLNAPAD
jgi:TolB-like protein